MKRIIIGITGATGTIYGSRLMEMLREEGDTEIHLVMSPSAKLTLKMEYDVEPDYINSLAHEVHAPNNIGASISSGSFASAGMIVAPCSIKTMSNICKTNIKNISKICQKDVKKMSKRCQKDVKQMSRRCQTDAKNMLNRCKTDAKTISKRCKKDAKKMSNRIQKDCKKMSKRCQTDYNNMSKIL